MKLVFLGPPGAGKGTQALAMAERFGVEHASTGDIFRKAVAGGSELGSAVKSRLDSGELVSDELTARVVREMVLERQRDFILDGFPRTLNQAALLDKMLEQRGEFLSGVVYFHLENQEAVERLTGRLVCEGCGRNFHTKFLPPAREGICDDCGNKLIVRSDSSLEVVEKRLHEYDIKTRPLIDYYSGKGLLRTVDASQSPQKVAEDTIAIIEDIE